MLTPKPLVYTNLKSECSCVSLSSKRVIINKPDGTGRAAVDGYASILLWPWSLTFWYETLLSTSVDPNTPVTKIGWNSVNWFLRYDVHKVFGTHILTHGRTHSKTVMLPAPKFFVEETKSGLVPHVRVTIAPYWCYCFFGWQRQWRVLSVTVISSHNRTTAAARWGRSEDAESIRSVNEQAAFVYKHAVTRHTSRTGSVRKSANAITVWFKLLIFFSYSYSYSYEEFSVTVNFRQ